MTRALLAARPQDHYDRSNEILSSYLSKVPDSAIAVNLKACNTFRLFNGKAAEAELSELGGYGQQENDLVAHNKVVFRGGEGALQLLPPLQGFIPEARLNLVIHYLRAGEVAEAFGIVKDMEPQSPHVRTPPPADSRPAAPSKLTQSVVHSPRRLSGTGRARSPRVRAHTSRFAPFCEPAQEFILKGVVLALVGQATDNAEHLKQAHQYLQLVGSSKSECDTIPGRQCMASAYFLAGQFEDVLVYLKSIKQYHANDDDFRWNHGVALAAAGRYAEAEEELLSVKREGYQREPVFLLWVARCLIANGKAKAAWEIYAQQDGSGEAFGLLQLIAHDTYARGAFLYAAKAFDALERIDPNPKYWEGKRGACAGVFQARTFCPPRACVWGHSVSLLRRAPRCWGGHYHLRWQSAGLLPPPSARTRAGRGGSGPAWRRQLPPHPCHACGV